MMGFVGEEVFAMKTGELGIEMKRVSRKSEEWMKKGMKMDDQRDEMGGWDWRNEEKEVGRRDLEGGIS